MSGSLDFPYEIILSIKQTPIVANSFLGSSEFVITEFHCIPNLVPVQLLTLLIPFEPSL